MPLASDNLVRLELPLPADWLDAIDALRGEKEPRTEFVRTAIAAELRRRKPRGLKLSASPRWGRPKKDSRLRG